LLYFRAGGRAGVVDLVLARRRSIVRWRGRKRAVLSRGADKSFLKYSVGMTNGFDPSDSMDAARNPQTQTNEQVRAIRSSTLNSLRGITPTKVAMAAVTFLLMGANLAFAQGGTAPSDPIITIPAIWWIAPVGSIVALIFAWHFYQQMMKADEGDQDMIEIAAYVRDGAYAYLRQQYKVVTIFFVLVSVLLAVMAFVFHAQHEIVFVAFLTGGFFSGLCGFLGMKTATNAAHRTAAGARHSLNRGLVVAFRAGAVMGLVVVGFGLIDITAWFLLLTKGIPYLADTMDWDFHMSLAEVTVVMLTFGMGASSQALFARVGGGIYTKAADVGADLVGKVEAGIPEDDARNPATIADNVGDNVGDVAGMGADLYESYCGSILATAALGVAAAAALAGGDAQLAIDNGMKFLAAPMVLAGIGIILSIVGIYMVQTKEGASMAQLMGALGKGVNGSSVLIAGAAGFVCWMLFDEKALAMPDGSGAAATWWGIWIAIVTGLAAGIVIGKFTEYYTSYDFKPTQLISQQAITGPATVIIAGTAAGMKSTWASLLTIVIAIMTAFIFAGGANEFMLGLYGVGIAAVGMLATLGITLATDAYGPIADNAGGNAEMTEQDPEVRERTDALDALGNTTAATGKGFAIGSAALTALALLAAYVEEVRVGQTRQAEAIVTTAYPLASNSSAIYLGHRKFGMNPETTTGRMAADCLMLLEQHPHGFEVGTKYDVKSKDKLHHKWTLAKDGVEYDLVSAKRATMAEYMGFYDVTLMNPKVLCGMFCGVMLAFVFCAMTMEAVGRAANAMMIECRRQFGKMRAYLRAQGKDEAFIADPHNWPNKPVQFEGSPYPNYALCVDISTRGAQREMIIPSMMAIATPVLVGLVFDVGGVMGLLAGGLTSGFAVAIFMANAGGAWDNAKKLIETFGRITAKDFKENEQTRQKVPAAIRGDIALRAADAPDDMIVYGKGSEDHKAGIVGDTVGDPFKDTSGPSLNILIKLMSMVSVVFAGLIVKFAPAIGEFLNLP
jgi:H(+)-translocating pyrophosphatase